ncbi:CDGSH iron-sulfur domain-containing protein [Raoultibacter massiliensis]|uniref:CDGSH iron-sulfur domain-containing protein n=1 Tax=Raoultibacter massiliensis TaxID=1852371 RepID=UPI000C8419A9|nr:CDGSH iron-sulfur domain-containing protein [Raoultibacter massiliensis]
MEGTTQPDSPCGEGMKITITKDGPYIVCGRVPLKREIITLVGGHREYRLDRIFETEETYALCRCGRSKNMPFCDGSHIEAHFQGDETASREDFLDRADLYPGGGVDLFDDNRCAFARFCHREEGDVWSLTEASDDPHLMEEAVKASTDCPAGRLVHRNNGDGTLIEPDFEPEISLLEDPEKNVSSCLYVRGGIPLESADGTLYEPRNRYALCRCGQSRNKPFCDASHVPADFRDGL